MDSRALSLDVHELLEAFAAAGATQLEQMKELWRARGFSFIYEARPKTTEPQPFMQTLFSCALGYLSSQCSLSWRLGGLYVLYILYQTQDLGPKVKIYLSLEDLSNVLALVKLVKQSRDHVPLKIIQKLISENAFLFGHTSVTQKSVEEASERRMKQANLRMQQARLRLLSNVPINEHLFGNLATGLEMDESSDRSFREYNQTKERIFQRVNVQEQEATNTNIYEEINKASKDWDEFREAFLAEKQSEAQSKETGNSEAGGADIEAGGADMEDDSNDMAGFADDLDEILGS